MSVAMVTEISIMLMLVFPRSFNAVSMVTSVLLVEYLRSVEQLEVENWLCLELTEFSYSGGLDYKLRVSGDSTKQDYYLGLTWDVTNVPEMGIYAAIIFAPQRKYIDFFFSSLI